MTPPIKETQILFGEDARRFEVRMMNLPKELPKGHSRREANYRMDISII